MGGSLSSFKVRKRNEVALNFALGFIWDGCESPGVFTSRSLQSLLFFFNLNSFEIHMKNLFLFASLYLCHSIPDRKTSGNLKH